MRWTARRALRGRKPVSLVAIPTATVVLGVLLAVPADGGATGAAERLDPAYRLTGGTSSSGQSFGGLAAVGALFGYSSGKLGSHFCTASVVDSSGGDLAVTAAHCVSGKAGQVAFVPGYANGAAPYGIFLVAQVYTDQAWQASQDPDDDVAFLRLAPASDGIPVEDVTGAERLGVSTVAQQPGTGTATATATGTTTSTGTATGGAGSGTDTLVQVIGYPDGADQPVWCVNWSTNFSATQLQFDCDGYTDGTSGGPFLADMSASSGQGTVIGVIGGYEQGGLTPSVSYSSAFGSAVAALYQTAEAGG